MNEPPKGKINGTVTRIIQLALPRGSQISIQFQILCILTILRFPNKTISCLEGDFILQPDADISITSFPFETYEDSELEPYVNKSLIFAESLSTKTNWRILWDKGFLTHIYDENLLNKRGSHLVWEYQNFFARKKMKFFDAKKNEVVRREK